MDHDFKKPIHSLDDPGNLHYFPVATSPKLVVKWKEQFKSWKIAYHDRLHVSRDPIASFIWLNELLTRNALREISWIELTREQEADTEFGDLCSKYSVDFESVAREQVKLTYMTAAMSKDPKIALVGAKQIAVLLGMDAPKKSESKNINLEGTLEDAERLKKIENVRQKFKEREETQVLLDGTPIGDL